MALAIARGEIAIVDQVNRRVQRFKDGKVSAILSIGGDTVQDLALFGDKTVLLDRLADRNVQIYDREGKLENESQLVGKGIQEGGTVTGLFTDDDGIYVERSHDVVVRIADARGAADPARPELPGRPTRDGRLWISAQLLDRSSGVVAVRAIDRQSGQPAWQSEVPTNAPIQSLVMLDSDRNGMVYIAADVGTESPTPPYSIADESIQVTRLGTNGVQRGTLTLPPLSSADETFRPLTVDDDGNLYEMSATDSGLQVTRYTFN